MVVELTHLTSIQIMSKYQTNIRMEKNGIKVGKQCINNAIN